MQEDDLKTITVNIAGRNFPVKITEDEEQIVRTVVLELNDRISEYQTTYPSRDKLDCVIMTLLMYTFDQKNTSENTDLSEISLKVNTLKSILSDIDLID
jgi:cell division protein ZapA (FtsZ GTPase activity inhibitor)